MANYCKAVNQDKKEYLCPFCLGGGGTFRNWMWGNYGALLIALLYHDGTPANDPEAGQASHGGRWAGDRVVIVDEYHPEGLYYTADEGNGYRNITRELVAEWNATYGDERRRMDYDPCGEHRTPASSAGRPDQPR